MENFALPKVTPLQLRDILYTLLLAWKTSDDFIPWLIVYGVTGVGKSEILGNLLENFSRLAKVPILPIYFAITKEGEAVTLPPLALLTKTSAEVVIFVDGIGFMSPALLTQMTNGLMASVKFKKVFVIAASNLPHESAGGVKVTSPIPPAMARFIIVHLVPDEHDYSRYSMEMGSKIRAKLFTSVYDDIKTRHNVSVFDAVLGKLQDEGFKEALRKLIENTAQTDEVLRKIANKKLSDEIEIKEGKMFIIKEKGIKEIKHLLYPKPETLLHLYANIAYNAIVTVIEHLKPVVEKREIPEDLPELPATTLRDPLHLGVRAALYNYSLEIDSLEVEKCAKLILEFLEDERNLPENVTVLHMINFLSSIDVATDHTFVNREHTAEYTSGFGFQPTLYEEHVSLLERIQIKEDLLGYSALNPQEVETFLQQLTEIWERDPELGRALDAITEANLSITSFRYILSLVTAFALIKKKEGKFTLCNVGKEAEKTEVQEYLDKILYPIAASMLGDVGIKIYQEKLRELLSDTRMLSLPPIEGFVTFLNRIRGAEAETSPPATQEFDSQFQV